MAACYSADEDGTVQLPYDTATGELRPEIWERWLAWDPVRMAPQRADALRSLRAIYIDCGTRDQFFLDLGAEAFRRELDEIGVTGLLLRALRRDALGDRVPLPAGDRVPGRAPVVILGAAGLAAAALICLDPGHGTPPAVGGQVEPIGPGSQVMKIKDGGGARGRGRGRARDRASDTRSCCSPAATGSR